MAFSLKKARLYPLRNPGATEAKNLQVIEISIGRIAGDTEISLFNQASQFFTDITANALSRDLANLLKSKINAISGFVENVVTVSVMNDTDVFVATKSALPTTTEYNVKNLGASVDAFKPVITIGTAGAVGTNLKIALVVSLNSQKDAITLN